MASAIPDPARGMTPSKEIDGRNVDAGSGGYAEDLYAFDAEATRVSSLEAMGDEEMRQYHDAGFLAVENAFDAETVSAVIEAIRDAITGEATGRTRVQYESWSANRLDELDGRDRLRAARKLTRFAGQDPRFDLMIRHPGMLDLVSRLMGGSKPTLLQEMALLKPPGGREKPWHQDRAYFNVRLEDSIIGVWIALDEATPENGCMRVWPGRHREGPINHFQRRDWQICDGDIAPHGRVAVPLKAGGALFFHSLLPHGTPRNATNDRRWALQLHFHAAEAVITTDDERLAVFGGEGKNVEC